MKLRTRRRAGETSLRSPRQTSRTWNAAGLAICVAAMAYALYLQHVKGLEPCHLCVFQRLVMILLGIVFAAALVHDPRRGGARVYALLSGVFAVVGMAVAGRHVWLQQQPPGSVGACGASLDVMLQMLPPSEVVLRVFKGGAECQKIDWQWLGLSMPGWVFVLFALLGAIGVIGNGRGWRWSGRY